jgi:flagellar protein FlgJ
VDISKINDSYIDNLMENTKNRAADGDFEARLKSALDESDKGELKKVCKEFEGLMLKMMFKEMRATVPKSDLIEEDAGREIFESMLDEKLIDEAAQNGSFGMADLLYNQLSKQMESKYVIVEEGAKKIDEKK